MSLLLGIVAYSDVQAIQLKKDYQMEVNADAKHKAKINRQYEQAKSTLQDVVGDEIEEKKAAIEAIKRKREVT